MHDLLQLVPSFPPVFPASPPIYAVFYPAARKKRPKPQGARIPLRCPFMVMFV